MDQNQSDIAHPMNSPDALIARFQFLRIPHGDGLDMNEPHYNKRINAHLSSYSLNHIKSIIDEPENIFLRDNLYVVPFLYARYEVIPSQDIIDYFKEILEAYKDSENVNFIYFIDNFEDIINQRISDTPDLSPKISVPKILFMAFIIWLMIELLF
jgi:hypothetical protein